MKEGATMATLLTTNLRRLLSLLHLLAHFSNLGGLYAEATHFPSEANPTTLWTNHYISSRWVYSDNTYVRPVLAHSTNGYLNFGFGFLKNDTSDIFYLAVIKIPKQSLTDHGFPPVILWCANRNRPVGTNATLEFKASGDLVLTDFDVSVAWSSETNNSKATKMYLDDNGNLKLYRSNGSVVWSSFGNPTNTWVAWQTLRMDQKLISSVSASNWSRGMYYVKIVSTDIRAYVGSQPAKRYGMLSFMRKSSTSFGHGSLDVTGDNVTFQSQGEKFQYIRMDHEGHLGVYELDDEDGSSRLVVDLLTGRKYGECGYPNVCGNYGVCSNLGGNCDCPGENGTYFKQMSPSDAHSGCMEVNHLTCSDTNLHRFVELENVTYFHFSAMLVNVDAMTCKSECMMNCSCKAAFFRYYDNASIGNCSLENQQILSLIDTDKFDYGYVDLTFIKVQSPRKKKKIKPWIVAIVWAAALLVTMLFLAFMSGSFRFYKRRVKKRMVELPNYDESIVSLPNQLTKFSFEDLKSATDDFRSKLGQGGFGSVYEGTLKKCGTKIAVKHLVASIHQCKRSFVAEVKTIGGIHHINLVRLVGYCVEGSNRLLVYEHMCNGSLDSWIFHRERATNLKWETRWKIIVGIAKGLEYLHDLCNKNIIHFDIKPQNILLDKDFNVKIADFGLARLFDKDKSHISTLPKGTLGYMAPELMKGKEEITVKIDIYSLGIVMLEMVCGRRNSDYSCDTSLVEIVKAKAQEDRLAELIDQRVDDDMKKSCNRDEAVETLRIAISCLQPVSTRPTASMVVKMLEGLVEVEPFADYNFLDPFQSTFTPRDDFGGSPPPSNSVLSGPR